MLPYVLILILSPISSLHGICQKKYTVNTKHYNPNLYLAITSIFAMMFFIVASGFKMNFTLAFIPYSILFAVTYCMATVGSIYAITYGPMAISSLLISYSLLVPTIFGIIVLHEKLHKTAYIGIMLVCISLYLVNTRNDKQPLTLKWAAFVVLGFIGNGVCSTTQKMEQLVFKGGYKSEFMTVALFISAVILFVISRTGAGNLKDEIKDCRHYPIISGTVNGINNMLVMILTGMLPTAILFPTLSAYGMSLTYVISRFLFNEKLTKKQTIGYIVGAVSIIFLNL